MIARTMLILTLGFVVSAEVVSQDKKDDALEKAKAAVEKQVQDWKGTGYRIQVVDDKYVREVFPNQVFVAVHFPLWPVARKAPEPMNSQNLFAVTMDGKVTHLADNKKLEDFFKSTLGDKLNQDKTVRTWLRLRMEYIQDGFYKFKYPEKAEVTGPGSSLTLVTGIVEVVPEGGNKGSFKAVVRFDRADKFSAVTEEKNDVKQGMRPRCQATLLLHPEKLVREIAEQDLVVMGSMAKEYLMEQRAKASAELRREIDRVWQRIEAEGR
jgi:biotin operon repressor